MRKNVPEELYPYYDYLDELTGQEDLVFKGKALVVSVSMLSYMLHTLA